MDEDFARLTVDIEIEQDVLVDLVIVPEIVGIYRISPLRGTGVGVAREDRRGPEIVAGALIGIPRAWIGGAVIDEFELGVVANPAPYRPAAVLPVICRPRRNAKVLA